MNKAFVFDMDGVIIDSENAWKKYESNFYENIFGKEINSKVGNTIGLTVNTVYDKAKSFGFTMLREEFQSINDRAASNTYDLANITPGIELLVNFLIKNNFRLGLASSTATRWINKVLQRLKFGDKFERIVSLNDRLDIKPKPNPDGYIETMRSLGSYPDATIILEDSNSGLTAAKASGAFTIAFTQNLVKGYKQINADAKADTMEEVIEIVKNFGA